MLRGVHKWGWGYLKQRLCVLGLPPPTDLVFCMADHFEPFCRKIEPDGTITGGWDTDMAMRRVTSWFEDYRRTVEDVQDDDGRGPQHTFFYPWDEYDPKVVEAVSTFCTEGFGEVEIHLHHRADTVVGLRAKLEACRDTFANGHGLLGRYGGQPGYAFVHGNWALCDSRPDGDWCGVAQELAVLRATGCYMDCTFPSAPSQTQPRFVNRIYYGGDPPAGHRGHRDLAPVRVKREPPRDGLLMLPGPLGLNWRERRHGWRPRLENGEITARHPATEARFLHWCRLQIHVGGCPEWLLVKLHTHGLDQLSRGGVTGDRARAFHRNLRAWCQMDGMRLHYVSAREMYNIIKAAEAGQTGSPGDWRDSVFAPPPVMAR